MANKEHLKILKQGVVVWNEWRQNHQEIQPDLRGAHLNGADLSYADLSLADLMEVELRSANLRRANLSRADLGYALQLHFLGARWR